MSSSFTLPVDEALRAYLVDIAQALGGAGEGQPNAKPEDDVEEQPGLLPERALAEISGNELKVASDAECSRILQDILRKAPVLSALAVGEALGHRETLWKCSTKCASHSL
jgi:hypothetical protein